MFFNEAQNVLNITTVTKTVLYAVYELLMYSFKRVVVVNMDDLKNIRSKQTNYWVHSTRNKSVKI